MKVKRSTSLLALLPVLLFLAGSIVFSGCEASRTGPELPRPNPPAPAPTPVVLNGYVLDDVSGSGIAGATVSIAKLDGTVVTTASTNASGMYSVNLTATNFAETNFKVATTVTGYGYGFVLGSYDKNNNSASITPLLLKKIANTTTVTIGTAGGAATVPPTTDAVSTTPVQVTVPPNAVPANTQVTVASIPVASTPPPASTATNIVSSNNLEAPGVTTFGSPVTMTFNLPMTLPAGTLIPLIIFNKTTNLWENTGSNATVAANGTTASVQVTKPGSYALLGNVTCVQTVNGTVVPGGITITRTSKVMGTKDVVIELSSTKTTATYTGSLLPAPTIIFVSGSNHPTSGFSYGLIRSRFARIFNPLIRMVKSFSYNLPATINGSPTTQNGVVVGPVGYETTAGEWINVITVSEATVLDVFRLEQAGLFTQDVNFGDYNYGVTSQWYWRVHNQGGIGVGPF